MYLKTIDKDEIAKLPLFSYQGDVVVVDSYERTLHVLPYLLRENVLGFDTETRPSFQKGHLNKVALLQLAARNKVFLFRLQKINTLEPLIPILCNPKIIKTGVAIHDDTKMLKRMKNFVPAGFVDLQNFVKSFGIEEAGLQKLAAIVLGVRISKGQQLSNWEADFFTEAQIRYAATDAWVCYEIFNKILNPPCL